MKTLYLLMFILLDCLPLIAQRRIVVAADGSGKFKTVQQAIDAAPNYAKEPVVIFIKKGIYQERITVPVGKTNITLVGDDAGGTILTYNNYAAKPDTAGKPMGTSRSASFYVYGDGFTAKNITFQNSAGPVGQALAIYVAGDKAAFFNCRFLGFQDTIYTHGNGSRQYYANCYIEGTIDFIFGAATALFDNCQIFCKEGGQYITAASTLPATKYGYVLMHCTVTGNAPANSYNLGRPWRPYAKVVYLYCNLSNVIKDSGWDNWGNAENEKTAYYAEYNNSGPGYQPGKRAAWAHQLTAEEAKLYTKQLILDGWEPQPPHLN